MDATTTHLTAREGELLPLARGGDERAYAELVDPHRRSLHSHCYRMLGSIEDADDALQETLLLAWRGLGRFERRSSLRTWLYRIATNTCLRAVAKQPRRMLATESSPAAPLREPPGRPLSESVWLEPFPDEVLAVGDGKATPSARYEERESVELAFVAALQHLPARQRGVLLLREVLGYSAREVAELLDTTVASVNSALQRARQTAAERVPEQSQQVTLRSLGDAAASELVNRYMDTIERADIDGLVELLTEDAVLAMPPLSTWYHGHEAIAAFWKEHPGSFRWRHLPTRASGQLAIASYAWDPLQRHYAATAIDVLTLRGPRIAEITAFLHPRLFGRFGLPDSLPAT